MRNNKGQYTTNKVPLSIKLLLGGAVMLCVSMYVYNVTDNTTVWTNTNTATSTTQRVETKNTFEQDIEKQIATSKKFVAKLKENHDKVQKAEVLRARAEQAYKEATEQYNVLVKEENALIESVKMTNPVALQLYYDAGMSQSMFSTSTVASN